MQKLYRHYLARNIANDISRFARYGARRLPEDRDAWLHRVGLASYHPARASLIGTSLFVVGSLFGAGLAIFFAPKTGEQMRAVVKERAKRIAEQAREQLSERAETLRA